MNDCPDANEPECATQTAATSWLNRTWRSPHDGAAADAWVAPFAFITVSEFADSAAAEQHVQEELAKVAPRFTGTFDFPPAPVAEGFTPGHRGEGTLEDVTIGAWTGSLGRSQQSLISPDGSASAAYYSESLTLINGAFTLTCLSDDLATNPDLDVCLDLATATVTKEVVGASD